MHKWRSEEQAILVGTQTALKDDPSLTTRLWPGNNPIRCVIDIDLVLPGRLRIFDQATPTFIFNCVLEDEKKNIKWIHLFDNGLPALLASMYQQNIVSVIVEGGAKLLQSFIDTGLWDEARVIQNEKLLIKNGLDAPLPRDFILQEQQKYFNDTVSYFLPSSRSISIFPS